MDKPLHIIPAVHADLNECMQWPGTKVLMKTGSKMPQVRAFLKNHGMDASLVQNCGLESERICTDMEQADDSIGYFTTIVVKQEG